MKTALAPRGIPEWHSRLNAELPEPSLRSLGLVSALTLVLTFGSFLTWACTASLDGAAMANGVVTVESHRKTIDNLEGGILAELLVKEGDQVKAGQPLLRLDPTLALAQRDEQRAQFWPLLIRATRLQAEQSDAQSMTLPDELTKAMGDPEIAALVATEQQLFAKRLDAYGNTVAIDRRKIGEMQEQINAAQAQIDALRLQQGYTQEELNGVRQLLDKGYERKPRLLELQSAVADLRGRQGQLLGSIAQFRQAIAGAELEILGARQQREADAGSGLQDATSQLAEARERLRAAENIRARKTILAPQDGVVTNIRYHTVGGTIPPAQPVLDIVPFHDGMLVEAQILPNDIEHVKLGEPVNLRLTAYKQHKVPILQGTVIYVAADRLTDAKGEDYFLARIELAADTLNGLKNVRLTQGMPVEVMIISGQRRAIDYFISPIMESTRRAFRED